MKRLIISICGGSGTGKSILAKHLVERLGTERAVRIPTDCYLKSNPYPTLVEFSQHPLQYDWELLECGLAEADGTQLTTPRYDFIHFQRAAAQSGLMFVMRPLVILDAMLPYPEADVTILIECPPEERRRRIFERDQRWKTQVIDHWDLHQLTLAELMRSRTRFDLVLDGMETIEGNGEKARLLIEVVSNQR